MFSDLQDHAKSRSKAVQPLVLTFVLSKQRYPDHRLIWASCRLILSLLSLIISFPSRAHSCPTWIFLISTQVLATCSSSKFYLNAKCCGSSAIPATWLIISTNFQISQGLSFPLHYICRLPALCILLAKRLVVLVQEIFYGRGGEFSCVVVVAVCSLPALLSPRFWTVSNE